MDALVGSGLWRPAALWALIEDGRRGGLVAPDDAAGPGCLRWSDPGRRAAAVLGAAPEDFAALLAHPPFPALLLAGARGAAAARDYTLAAPLYGALAATPDPATFPGGEPAWVGAIVESIRLFRSMWALPHEAMDRAIASAEARGDLAAQALLLAARGLQALADDPARSHALYARAAEAAEAAGDPALRDEVRGYIALSLVFQGRLREGIAAVEEMLGDVPADLFEPRRGGLVDLTGATPASPLAVLAWAYASAGETPRALDLLHRMAARGAELGNAPLEAQGRLFLAITQAMAGELDAALPHAQAAHAWWSSARTEPTYAWFAAATLAALRARADRCEEARRLLEGALPAWRSANRPVIGGSMPYALLGALERAGLPPLEGLDLDGLVAEQVAIPSPLASGVALRWRARRRLALPVHPEPVEGRTALADARAEAARDLSEAVRRLRDSGAAPELALALDDAAALAEGDGRGEEAARHRREAAELARPRALPAADREAGRADPLRLASALLELGRLGALAPRREGLWGEVAARLCRDFGAERCALLELGADGPVLLAVRGMPAWQEALLARLRGDAPATPTFGPALPEPRPDGGAERWIEPGDAARPPSTGSGQASIPSGRVEGAPDGQLVLVPFADEALGRRGFVALENRHARAAVGPGDEALLEALGRQVGILLANVTLWRELHEARQRLELENRYYREAAPAAPLGAGRIVGRSPAMQAVLGLVARVAPTGTPVLVTGETGVGKELVSREVHHLSSRRDGPFIAVHVAALAPGLVTSALFGHERGAFTGATEQTRGRFELADGGTLLLDEVGELSPEDQVRLLRVLQEGTFERVGGTRTLRSDFRLVAVTNRDLAAEVRAGRFREDLYFRLAAFPITVPPLRHRSEEIPTLALYFMERSSRKLGLKYEGIGEADMARLVDYPWPGNVRELEHVIERAALLSEPPRLRIPLLEGAREPRAEAPPLRAHEWVTLEEAERRYVRAVLHHVGGRVNGAGGAAEVLGLKPSTLQFRIDKLGLREELSRARRRRGEKD